MSDEIQPFSQVVNTAFSSITATTAQSAHSVITSWKKVLLRIKSNANPCEGKNLADHSRVVDLKNGVLLVEADHPGWIELLQLHKKFIITGLQMNMPGTRIDTMAFTLRGKRGNLYAADDHAYSEQEVRAGLEKRIDAEEKALNSIKNEAANSAETTEKKPLPPELAVIFEDLRQSMLTNSQK